MGKALLANTFQHRLQLQPSLLLQHRDSQTASHRAHGIGCQQQLLPHMFLAPSLHFQQLEIVTNTFKCSHDVSFPYRQLLLLAQGSTLQRIEKAVTTHSQIGVLMVHISSVAKKGKVSVLIQRIPAIRTS